MPRICSVPGCNGRGGFNYPVGREQRQRWIEALNITHLPAKTIEKYTVCPRHFIKSDYISSDENFYTGLPVVRKRLKSTAVPSVNLVLNPNDEIENEDPDEISSNAAVASLQDHDYNFKSTDESMNTNFIMEEGTSGEVEQYQVLENNVISIELNDENINKILELYNLEEDKTNNSKPIDGFGEETVIVKVEQPNENFIIQNIDQMETNTAENDSNAGIEKIKIENVYYTKSLSLSSRVCCIKGCDNTNRKILDPDNPVKYYNFPTDKFAWRNERRRQWVQAVIKHNNFSSDWQPKKYTTICSAHFVGGKKNEHPMHPGYNPTIFPGADPPVEKTDKAVKKFERYIQRYKNQSKDQELPIDKPINKPITKKITKKTPVMPKLVPKRIEVLQCKTSKPMLHELTSSSEKMLFSDFQCQVDFLNSKPLNNMRTNSMICNRKFENNLNCVEIQVYLQKDPLMLKAPMKPKIIQNIQLTPPFNNTNPIISSSTTATKAQDSVKNLVFPRTNLYDSIKYCGIINSDDDLKCMCGVTFQIFNDILSHLPEMPGLHLSNANRLLIFLMKLKSGINNSTLALLFNEQQETIAKIFDSTLSELVDFFKNKVLWPSREEIDKALPEVFKNTYSKCKAMVDYMQIAMEIPETQPEELLFYSTYKNCLNFKVVVAFAPSGFIVFKSKCYYGQQNDIDIMRECEFFTLVKINDVILADKEFPSIRNVLESKQAVFVVPPLVQNVQPTSVHIHIKQCINRVKFFKILTSVPVELFSKIDDIIYVCCSIVNLQTPLN